MTIIQVLEKNLGAVLKFLGDFLNSSIIELQLKKKQTLETTRKVEIKTSFVVIVALVLGGLLLLLRHYRV